MSIQTQRTSTLTPTGHRHVNRSFTWLAVAASTRTHTRSPWIGLTHAYMQLIMFMQWRRRHCMLQPAKAIHETPEYII